MSNIRALGTRFGAISGQGALAILELWMEGEWQLTEVEFEFLWDRVTATLEEANNHKYRFTLTRRDRS